MSVYVNRTLNMKKIKAIGFDMDYTLVRYKTEAFEKFVFELVLEKLVEIKKYPAEITNIKFDFNQVIQGLIIDKLRGNILQTNRYGKVKIAKHGTKSIDFRDLTEIYGNSIIDLNSDQYQSLDTNFSISNGAMFSNLVDLKDNGLKLPDYETLSSDIKEVIDIAHSDGSLKGHVQENLEDFIIADPEVAKLLERFKRFGKKLILITNSEWSWTKSLMEHTIDPFLKEHDSWMELFDISICLAFKPRFFSVSNMFLEINPDTGFMTNAEGPLEQNKVYQGGWAGKLQKDLGLEGEEILYLGDHIYGDVLTLKKTFNWRTALIFDPLQSEIDAIKKSAPTQALIDAEMKKKEKLEHELNKLELLKHEDPEKYNKEDIGKIFSEIDKINTKISQHLETYRQFFNPHWGEMMRAGLEESRFADQVEKYACFYMAKITDLLEYTPRTYFRPTKRVLAHEITEPNF
ncbi:MULTISPECIES: HAD-IG family 5'-nucleotidase [Halobacteriovorax]|uniref:5'-nucleotidase n=1 Tax=Halobacteriovorax vibrionivorans TaxID=2152716 RepID=A0ABY0IHX8_9BACT|nr:MULTISPECIES: HAD-IG family 5'-nucleotidase [Halobacteriovorax]AYF45116.1 HAD superfamily (subfamily IG) hydrolase, 5'-nucleotidase [Halobacteriovorax sp. BALOs_7]RZF22212.1 5'-nucleotidase [Halobacteriovorax vibrionivorans]TGD48464.1 5'-nucleotidase [Halobacteriovorax sp. Y22]